MMWIAWLILGLGRGIGLYDTAFAALGRIYGLEARSAITGITLVAGFASTIGWPVTAWGVGSFGWRETCFAWAAAHIVLGLPLNLLLPKAISLDEASCEESAKPHIPLDRPMIVLGLAFAASWMVVAAMAVHLPRLLEAAGATATRLSVALHPIGASFVGLLGAGAAAAPFTVLHGAGSGILTIARGTVPLAMFGPKDYGYRLGILGAPSRAAMAAAPLLFGVLIELYGAGVLLFSSLLSITALRGAEYREADRDNDVGSGEHFPATDPVHRAASTRPDQCRDHSAAENAAKNQVLDTPSSCAI